jgi:RNA polymerase sigma factor (sigma-70 family)
LAIHNVIEALKNGSTDALQSVINDHQNNVYNICIGLLQNAEDAEEVTQDIFVQLYYKISSFKGESQFSTWLYRIAVNECLQFLRKAKAKKRLQFFGLGKKEEANAIEFVHPGILLEQKENAAILYKAIKKLPSQQQVAFTLKNMEQLKQNEIAAIMQLSEGAVESLLQRAKQNLKKEISILIN